MLLGASGVDHFVCDLADLQSVRRAASELKKKHTVLDVLINNAGGIIPELRYSADNLEYTFAMNHLGHFFLTKLLKDELAKSDEPRVISVSSEAHRMGKLNFTDLSRRKESYSGFKAYADAKLCNIYFTKALVEKWKDINIRAYCLHPGVVNTGFGSEYKGIMGWLIKLGSFFMISSDQGSKTSVYLAETRDHLHNGAYFKKSKEAKSSEESMKADKAEKLWNYSEELIAKSAVGAKVSS